MKKVNKPVPTGEYAVGTFTYTVKDVREEVMKPGTMRSVAARVYYPVNKADVEGFTKTGVLVLCINFALCVALFLFAYKSKGLD